MRKRIEPTPERGAAARPGPKPKHPSGKTMRDARPRQIAARVEPDTFKKMSALRRVLDADNAVLIDRGMTLLIQELSPPQRKAFDLFYTAERAL